MSSHKSFLPWSSSSVTHGKMADISLFLDGFHVEIEKHIWYLTRFGFVVTSNFYFHVWINKHGLLYYSIWYYVWEVSVVYHSLEHYTDCQYLLSWKTKTGPSKFDGLMQNKCKSSALTMELYLFCINWASKTWLIQHKYYYDVWSILLTIGIQYLTWQGENMERLQLILSLIWVSTL